MRAFCPANRNVKHGEGLFIRYDISKTTTRWSQASGGSSSCAPASGRSSSAGFVSPRRSACALENGLTSRLSSPLIVHWAAPRPDLPLLARDTLPGDAKLDLGPRGNGLPRAARSRTLSRPRVRRWQGRCGGIRDERPGPGRRLLDGVRDWRGRLCGSASLRP